jgi:hypothetical protein
MLAAAEADAAAPLAERRADAREALQQKLAEAEKLYGEIERLRQLTGQPPTNAHLRVRVVEVSLTNAENLLDNGPGKLVSNALELEKQLTRLLQDRAVATLHADETLTVADRHTARLRVGAKFWPNPSMGGAKQDEPVFQGTEITITPKWQADGRLLVELGGKKGCPVVGSAQGPYQHVHEVSTAVELTAEDAAILEGEEVLRKVPTVTGFDPTTRLARTAEIELLVQTFVIVTRETGPSRKPRNAR